MTRRVYLGFLDGYAPPWAGRLARGVERSIGHPVSRLDLQLGLPRFYSAERGQYNATLILAALLRFHSEPDTRIVGVTRVDLYIPVLTFVFGQAQLDGPGALVSTYRLRNEFYGLPESRDQLVERATKEVVHEAGHSFGLVHCTEFSCVMHAATYVEDVDLKQASFCPDCESRLQASTRAPRSPD